MSGKYTIAGGKVFDEHGEIVGKVNRSGKIIMYSQFASDSIAQASAKSTVLAEENTVSETVEISAGQASLSLPNRNTDVSKLCFTPASGAVPFCIPPNGNIGANGALTLGVGMNNTMLDMWMYFPAGAVKANAIAGYYYVHMTSPTTGTVYDVILGDAVPHVPSTFTPVVSPSVGDYTQTTGVFLPVNIGVVGARSLGNAGTLRLRFRQEMSTSGAKTRLCASFGDSRLGYYEWTGGDPTKRSTLLWQNAGQYTRQLVSGGWNGDSESEHTGMTNFGSVDTTQDQQMTIDMQLVDQPATNYVITYSWDATVNPFQG